MSLIIPDIDLNIISHIFSNNKKWNYKILKCIYYAFGKSKFDTFILRCKQYVFCINLDKHIIIDNDLYTLLQEKTRKNNPHFYQCYMKFYKELGNSLITFDSLNRRSRIIVYYLSLYHGYLFVRTDIHVYETFGYTYYDFYDDNPEYKTKPLKYSFLKRKRIHNLSYYDLVEKANNIYDSTFVLKPDISLYKKGATKTNISARCIKII